MEAAEVASGVARATRDAIIAAANARCDELLEGIKV